MEEMLTAEARKAPTFMEWFVAQHGKRPDGDIENLMDLVRTGEEAQRTIESIRLWDAKKESALYAWNISYSQKA